MIWINVPGLPAFSAAFEKKKKGRDLFLSQLIR